MTTETTAAQQAGVLLPGLDGTNPLGFLAALGVLRTRGLREGGPLVRMQWQQSGATWIPKVYGGGSNINELVDELIAGFRAFDPAPWTIHNKLPFEADHLRDEVLAATLAARRECRDRVDTLASFGVECIRDEKGNFKDTSLRMVRAGDSAGNGLLAYGKQIQADTNAGDLLSALTETWKYEDQRCALRWDPAEYHGYAMQWTDPSKEKTVSVRGANRLALAAMPLLSTVPGKVSVETVGFGQTDDRREYLTWPLWSVPCCLDVVESLLELASLQHEVPDPIELRPRGIAAIYRCDRIMTSTYYRNFTPSQRIA